MQQNEELKRGRCSTGQYPKFQSYNCTSLRTVIYCLPLAILLLVSTGCPPPSIPPPGSLPAYSSLHKKLDGGYCKTYQNRLYIHYEEEYAATNLKYKVLNKQNQVVLSDVQRPVNVFPWLEQYTLDLTGIVNGSDFFILEVTNTQGEIWYLRFQ